MQEPSLFTYQQAGVEKLLQFLYDNESRAALLADPPGAGKTAQALTIAKRLYSTRVLIVCPASLRINWARECRLWLGEDTPITVMTTGHSVYSEGYMNVLIVSYSLADNVRGYWDLVIFDESHALKSPSSNRSRSCLIALWNSARYRLLLSGTPIPNGRAAEAWTTFMRLSPESFGNWSQFSARYCPPVKDAHGRLSYPYSRNLEELGRIARERFMVRRSRVEVNADLPPLRRETFVLDMAVPASDPSSDFAELRDEALMRAIIEAVENDSIGALPTDAIATVRRKLGVLKLQPAIEYLIELIDQVGRVVVFCHHREVYAGLYEGLLSAPDELVEQVWGINGSMALEDRQNAVDAFQTLKGTTTRAAFIASITAASTGLTLTAADTVVFVEADWVPTTNEQAEGRVLRIGQEGVLCRAIYLLAPGTLDERVTQSLLAKQKNIKKLFPESSVTEGPSR